MLLAAGNKNWYFRLYSKYGDKPFRFEETLRKITRYFFTTDHWEYKTTETVLRDCASMGEAIEACFLLPVQFHRFASVTTLTL